MNDVIEAILARRSIRAFKEKRISDDDLKIIAKCAIHAPSARNRQLWNFTVVHNKEKISRLAGIIGKAVGADPSYNFYGPDAIIIASAPRDYTFGREDCSCAMQNIFLVAQSLGIGSVWINQLCDVSDEPEVRAALDELGVPHDNIVRGTAALGYAANDAAQIIKNEEAISFIN